MSVQPFSLIVVTARIRRMGKVIFSLCVSVHTSTGGVPGPGGGGGYLIQPWTGGSPHSQIFWGGGGGIPGLRFSRGGFFPGLRFSKGGGPRS